MGVDRPIDITADQRKTILALLKRHLPNTTAWAYGSRVKWTARPQSDLDLVVFTTPDQERRVSDLTEAFEESNLPFRVDLFVWDAVPEQFRKEIETEHVVLVERGEQGVVGEWYEIPLAQLLAEPVRNGIYKKKEFHGRGTKIVNMGELFAYPRLPAVPMKRVELSESEADRFLITAGDLLFARRSLVAEGAGKCCVVLDVDEPTTFESSIIRVRLNSTKADSLYLYYFFNSALGLYHLDTIRRQVAVAGITGSDLAKLDIPVPPLSEQRVIAHVLGTLDDKIELNRRMNETLEAMARALFKSWFIDFDPVRAKMAGRDPGLPQHLADLFPDRLVDSELGPIPEGWEVKALSSFGKIITGKTPSTLNLQFYGNEVPFLKIPDMHGRMYVTGAGTMLSRVGADSQMANGLPPGSISVSCIATPGLVVLNHRETHTNQQINSIIPNDRGTSKYLYWSCRKLASEIMLGGSGGSVFHNMNKSTFSALKILDADMEVISSFEKLVCPMHEMLLSNEKYNHTLATLRDVLLHKLISGELRVKNAERFIEEAKS